MEALGPGDPRDVGPYRLAGVLGSGGMGRVYLGHSRSGRAVAIKMVHGGLAQNPDFRARFAREIAAARAVSGVFTAAVVDADPAAERPWLATAYVEAPTLSQYVEAHGRLPESSLRFLAAGLAEALDAIHRAGVIHRDLKPSNVLLAPDGPRVIDFGIARALDVAADAGITGAQLLGSPGFMAPEQLTAGAELGPACDVFCLGLVLCFAAGVAPFGEGPAQALFYRIVHESADLSGVPDATRAIVAACLAKDPAARPTPAQVLDQTATTESLAPAPTVKMPRSAPHAPATRLGPPVTASWLPPTRAANESRAMAAVPPTAVATSSVVAPPTQPSDADLPTRSARSVAATPTADPDLPTRSARSVAATPAADPDLPTRSAHSVAATPAADPDLPTRSARSVAATPTADPDLPTRSAHSVAATPSADPDLPTRAAPSLAATPAADPDLPTRSAHAAIRAQSTQAIRPAASKQSVASPTTPPRPAKAPRTSKDVLAQRSSQSPAVPVYTPPTPQQPSYPAPSSATSPTRARKLTVYLGIPAGIAILAAAVALVAMAAAGSGTGTGTGSNTPPVKTTATATR